MYGGGCGGDGDVGGEGGGGGRHNGDLTSVESPCSGTVTCGKCLLLGIGYLLQLIITLNISWPMHVFSLCIH